MVNFKNTILLMTPNVAPEELKSRFRPEFLNRIDEQLTFRSLDAKDLRRIVDIQLALVAKRLEDKRAIQKHLVDPLARLLLAGDVREGQSLSMDVSKDKLTFKGAAALHRSAS